VRYDECRPGEEVIYVVSTIGRKAASIKAGAEHSNQWSIIEQCKQHLALFVEVDRSRDDRSPLTPLSESQEE